MLLVSTYLTDVGQQLPGNQFLRISRFHLINTQYLQAFERKSRQVVLKNTSEIRLKVTAANIDKIKNI